MIRRDCSRCVLAFFIITLLCAQFFLWGAPSASHSGSGGMVLASLWGSDSKSAPDFELQDLNGSSVRLSSFKGKKPVLIYFWATWCPYCITVKPAIADLRKEIAPSELEILSVNVGGGDSLERVKRYQERNPAPYAVVYDGEGKVSRSYQVQGIPLFVLVDKEGKVIFRGNDLPKDTKKLLRSK